MAGRPLEGVKVLEFAGLGPGPFAGQLLADLGADVILVDRPTRGPVALEVAVERRGKRSVVLDLKTDAGREVALALAADAQMLIEGNRPGVMERLGLGPEDVRAANPALVYGRMTGWGQTGPYAGMAGHDLNYIGLTGALAAMGPKHGPPMPPLNLLGDFGGGAMFLVMGLLAGHIDAQRTGRGCVVDAAITDGVNALMGMIHSWHAAGRWQTERAANPLDGSAPYYRCYCAACGGFLSVAAIEPQFHAALLEGLGLTYEDYGVQFDRSAFGEQAALLEHHFSRRSVEDWMAVFEGTDACVAPVLDYRAAVKHPQNQARKAFSDAEGLCHPRPAPVFDGALVSDPEAIARDGSERDAILAAGGFSQDEIARLAARGAFGGVA